MIPAHARHAAHVIRLRSGHEAREQKRNKPWPTGPHRANQGHRFRAQNAPARAQPRGSELWSPVRDEEAAWSKRPQASKKCWSEAGKLVMLGPSPSALMA